MSPVRTTHDEWLDDEDLCEQPPLDDSDGEHEEQGALVAPSPEPYALSEQLCNFDGFRHAAYLRVPVDQRHWGRANMNFGQRYLAPRNYDTMYESDVRRYRAMLNEGKRPAALEITDDAVTVECGIQRGRPLTPREIQTGIRYHGQNYQGWQGRYASREFYPSLIHPYVRNNPITTPFEWAYERAQLANGFAGVMGLSRDFRPAAAEYPYKALAGRVCNTGPESLKAPRRIPMDDGKKKLLDVLKDSLNGVLTPETVWLILENANVLTPEMLQNPRLKTLLCALPQCLEHGLIIDRLQAFFQMHLAKGLSAAEALQQAVQVVVHIYGKKQPAWWFKEDIDFTKVFDWDVEACTVVDGTLKIAYNAEGREIVEAVAKSSDSAFEYALAVQKTAGYALRGVEGLTPMHTYHFCAAVTKDYGIGNTARAANVIRFCRELMDGIQPAQRPALLHKFQKYIHRQKPETEIVGRLEGAETSIYFPGLTSLLSSQLGDQAVREDSVDDLTITPKHLRAVAAPLGRPLEDRARVVPPVRGHLLDKKARLLTETIDHRLALPIGDALLAKTPEEDPLVGIFDFYEQLKAECDYEDTDVAFVYFTFFAPKMPRPFHPPRGFLRFLQRFGALRDPEWQWADAEAPWARDKIRERNAALFVERRLVISNLIDALVMGLITEERLHEILESIVNPDAKPFTNDKVLKPYRAHYAQSELGDPEVDHSEMHARFACLKDAVRMVAVHAMLVSINALTREHLREIVGHTALSEHGEGLTLKDVLPGSETVETIFPYANAMVASGCLSQITLEDGFGGDSIMERYYFKDNPEGRTLPMRLRDFWRAAESFKLIHAGVPEIEERARREIHRHLRMTDFEYHRMEGEIANVVQLLAQDGAGAVRSLGERLCGRSIFRMDMDRFIAVYFPLKRFCDLFYDLWLKLYYRIKIPMAAVCALVDEIPRATEIEEVKPKHQRAIPTVFRGGFALSPVVRLASALGAVQEQREKNEKIGGAASKEARVVHEVTAGISAMVTFVLAISRVEEPLLLGISVAEAEEREIVPTGEAAEDIIDKFSAGITRLRSEMDVAAPSVKENILTARRNAWGLVPVGGKVHVLHPIDALKFGIFKQMAGFTSTGFQLIHANTSLLLPPTPSAEELVALINALGQVGVINDTFPELQVTLPGRLPPAEVAVLGSCILLATERGVDYDEKAFSTNQDSATGARIMAYDAGNKPLELPFMPKLKGRTDMLGRRHAGDIKIIQRVGTVLLQAHAGKGPFAKFAPEFMTRYRAILQRYGIEHILEGNWVFLEGEKHDDDAASRRHYLTVKACTDAYFDCARQYGETGNSEGIIFEVRALLEWLEEGMQQEQQRLLASDETCKEREVLLNL